jgi:thiamine pyrophosphokinase
MESKIVRVSGGITLIAGGPVTANNLRIALSLAPHLVSVDGGADRALRLGHMPLAATGDFDSISEQAKTALGSARLFPVAEQESTDFDKALRAVEADFVIGLGVLGGRVDHALAALNVLVRQVGPPCVLVGGTDVVFAAPARREINLALRRGDRFSLFPLARVAGESTGLDWPVKGLTFVPDGRIGTSNRVTAGPVRLWFDGAGMLVILPRGRLDAAVRALRPE